MSSSSWIMRRARSTTSTPSSVSLPLRRSTRLTPSSFSRREICAETLLCTVPSAREAAENDPWSAMAIRLDKWRISIINTVLGLGWGITKIDGEYRVVRLERLPTGKAYLISYRGETTPMVHPKVSSWLPQPLDLRLRGPA